ncbi:hypothetical protein BN2476_710006 [Paraburkholderia piptadeniae]|uniref:Uncharacterized protein n=1 Tax=Paraburkholderia piptadeniae TaxID=1701573 RepID=A0A1N7SQL4_9BURK|nr:hypothetical protein BN2476_710006 [Paraburkholderia piptadeniae]
MARPLMDSAHQPFKTRGVAKGYAPATRTASHTKVDWRTSIKIAKLARLSSQRQQENRND